METSNLYLNYDQAGLDAQYNLRAAVPAFPDFVADWAERSTRARSEVDCMVNLAYGPAPAEKLDLFPAGPGAPVHLFIHGGYWQSMDKDHFGFVAQGLVPKGAAVAVNDYALAPDVGMDEIVRQNRAALAWLWRHVADFGGDPNRIFVSGHSAGGHLTAMLLATDWPAFDPGLPKDLVKGGMAISGLFDLEPVRLCYLNQVLGMDAATAQRNSPVALVDRLAANPAPLGLCVGGDETDEFHRQQAEFAARLTAAGRRPAIIDMPGFHHFDLVCELTDPASPLTRAILRQMGL